MNTIPSVGPDTTIAPRTGSGSPQTPPQQRADAAPSVLSDNPATAADPGVMLKITPPVQSRQGDAKVTEQLQGRAMTDWASLISDPDVLQVAALTGSAKEADEAIQKRVAQAFEALPPDVQEAIRLASTPAIANLLRLAAITAPGIKEAPAVVQAGPAPMGDDVGEAVKALQQVLEQAPPFKLAQLLQELAGLRMPQVIAREGGEDGTSGSAQLPFTGATVQNIGQEHQPQSQMLAQMLLQIGQPEDDPVGRAHPQPASQSEQSLTQRPSLGLSASSHVQSSHESDQNFQGSIGQPTGRASGEAVAEATTQTPLTATTMGVASLLEENTPPQGSNGPGLQLASPGLTAHHTEAAIRDGLRLLMDGRMLWQGQFTPGVLMQFERSDAWRTNRRSLGGMEKGTSLKVKLQLPSLGSLEVRAMGFGGQVSVRLHADSKVAPTVATALPDLQARLIERGLAGAQVLVDSL